MINLRLATGVASLALTSALQSSPVAAQEDAESARRLGPVTVTAQRQEQNVQDVPIAISAYDSEQLEILQVDETLDLVNLVPNLFGGNNTGMATANMFYLRGVGNDESISTFDPPVGTYVDDIYIARQNANNFNFFDVERVEVLRGPQGTLFGRNTTGGAVNVIMRKPDTEFGGFAEIGVGSFNERLARASVDLPAGPSVRTKLSAFYVEDDGWLDNVADGNTYNDKQGLGLRGAVQVDLAEDVVWDASIDYIEYEASNASGEVVGDDRISTSLLPSQGLGPNFTAKAGYGNETENLNLTSNLGFGLWGGEANLILGSRQLEQGYLLNFPNAASDDFFIIDNLGEHDQLSAELKWVGDINERLNVTAGLFWLQEENTTDFADYLDLSALGAPVPPATFTRLADRVVRNDLETYALFAQGDFSLTDALTLTLGARWTEEKKDFGISDNTGNDILTTENLIAAGFGTQIHKSLITPRIALTYEPSEALMFYASATNGFKSGGYNARGTSVSALQPFGPEKVWSYEVGGRTELFDRSLILNTTAFLLEVNDLQVTSAVPSGEFLTTNAGSIENTGLEIDATWRVGDYVDLFAAIGLQDAKYVDLEQSAAICTVPNSQLAAFDSDCNVATVKRAPDYTVTLGATGTFPLDGLGGTLRPSASVRMVDDQVVGVRDLGKNDAYVLYNAGITYIREDAGWRIGLECNNCGNEEYITSILLGNEYYSRPGTWQLRLTKEFGARQ